MPEKKTLIVNGDDFAQRGGKRSALGASARLAMKRQPLIDDSDAMLRSTMGGILRGQFGERSVLTRVLRKRSEFSSWYGSDVLTAEVEDGRTFGFFLKDFGSYAMRKDEMRERRERERRVYEELLDAPSLGTPAMYGSIWDDARDRFWLILELVDGPRLMDCEFEAWLAAAEWLGRMQARFAKQARRLRASAFLVRHNTAFFLSRAKRAVAAVHRVSPARARRLATAIDRYDEIAETMAAQSSTLVHGGYRPQNILLRSGAKSPGVCPVDWEEAAWGCPFYDFAYLVEGFEGADLARLWAAWQAGAEAMRDRTVSKDMRTYLLNCFCLHKTLNSLTKCYERRFPLSGIDDLLSMAEKAAQRVIQ